MVSVPCPRRGDVVWVSLNPRRGHEQAGLRPAVVVSPEAYNRKTGLALLCPVTNRRKGYPFEVPLPEGFDTTGVVLADQVRSLDWRARSVEFVGALPDAVIRDVLAKLSVLVT